MFNAEDARELSKQKLKIDKILTYIKATAEKGWFHVTYKVSKAEIKCLKELGFNVSKESEILSNISWLDKNAVKSKVETPKSVAPRVKKLEAKLPVKWFRHSKQSLTCCGKVPTKWKRVTRDVADVDGMVTIKYKSYKCDECKKSVMPIGNFIAPSRMHSKAFIKMAVRLMKESGCVGASTLIKQTTGIVVDGSTIYNWKERGDHKL